MKPRRSLTLLLLCGALAAPLHAADNGTGNNGNADNPDKSKPDKGNNGKRPPAPPGSVGNGKGTSGRTELPLPPVGGGGSTNALVLASWLDDTETLPPGNASFGLAIGRSKALDGSETDAPVFDAVVGLAPRVHVGVSLPYYHASYDDGFESSGRGNTYLAVKVKLREADAHRVGLAVSPVIEILSDASVADPTLDISRWNWALPVSFQLGGERVRTFGSVGYFSRGALFAAGAVDYTVSPKLSLTGVLSLSHATNDSPDSDLVGLSRSRMDLSGCASYNVTSALSVSAGLGRTISSLDQNGSQLMMSAGIRYTVSRPSPARP